MMTLVLRNESQTIRTSSTCAVALALLTMTFLAGASQLAKGQTGDDALRIAQRAPGQTAKNLGLGGTGVAGVVDASAFFSNPAGLGWSDKSWFSGSVTSIIAKDEGVFQAPGSIGSQEEEVTSVGLGNLSYLVKIPTMRGAMVVGASISEVSSFERGLFFDGDNNANSITDFFIPFSDEFFLEDDGDGGVFPSFDRTLSFIGFETFAIDLDQDLVDAGDPVPFRAAVSAGTIVQTGFVEESGRMMELNVGGAIEVSKDVMIGASINVPFGTYKFHRVLEEDDFLNDNDGTGGTTDFAFLSFSERFESEIVGANLRVGISAQVNENLRLGASVETPTYYSIEDNFSTRLHTEFDNGDFYSYGGDSSERAGTGTFDYNVTTPWKLSLGASYESGDLKLLADVDWIDWSQLELDSDGFSFDDENLAIKQSLDAVVNVRVGASYDFNAWQFRIGAGAYQDPRGSILGSAAVATVDRERTYASGGVGYKISDKINVDIGWMAEKFDDRYDLYTEVTDAPFVLEEVTRHTVKIGLSFSL